MSLEDAMGIFGQRPLLLGWLLESDPVPKIARPLNASEVSRLTSGVHAIGGVSGLLLQVSESGARSWVLRAMVGKKRRDMGLGAYPTTSLAQARDRAREMRQKIWSGIDPVEERAARRRLLAHAQEVPTFDESVRDFFADKRNEFRNEKHAAQWTSTLKTYASPVFGALPVDQVDLQHVLRTLRPIWEKKTETASRLRGRIEAVLAWATVNGLRKGENPARWRGHLDAVLPKPGKIAAIEHHPAMPFVDLPEFMALLRTRDGIAARALEFAILTAARSGEVRGARWEEFDLSAGTWTIPAGRMKGQREHRVPLSPMALEILNKVPRRGDHVFAAPLGGQLSDATLSAVLRRMRIAVVPHGFRSTFRDWAGETTTFPREVIEHALAHQLKDKAEAAYARGSLFTKRRKLMETWASYCNRALSPGAVPPLRQVRSGERE